MRAMHVNRIGLLVAFSCLSAAALCGQSTAAPAAAGSIAGITIDDFGHPVALVDVFAKNAATGMVYRTASGPKGEYKLGGLPPGTYEFSTVVHGVTLFSDKNVGVTAGQVTPLDAHMHEASINAVGDNAFAAAAMEQRAIPKGPTPRSLDGHPDFSGVWATMRQISVTETELLPWAQAEIKQPGRMSPNAFCLPQGPRLGGANPFKLIQSPKTIVALIEDIFVYRQIHMDGRARPKDADPTWMGYSIGHWEGETLVVETANMNDKSWLPFNRPHKESIVVTERLRRPDEGHLEYEFIVNDPQTFTKPWSVKYATTLLAGDEIGEYICTENEQDVGHYKVQ
jgi:Carboxypeptidase regulatory-like domain